MMDVDSTNAKHAASQAKRLASLREKQDYQRQQQALISEALKSADKLPKTKRIVFDSDESDNDVDDVPKRSKKMNLFDDDDECPDLSETNPEQLVSSRFKGRGSEKLTKLQNSYGNDDRFKLDHTFLDDEEQVDEGEFNMEQEKERQMRMLSMVVGRDVIAKHSTTSKDQVKAKPFQRFDPFNPEHVAWVKNQQKSKDDDSEYEIPVAKKSKKEEQEQERPVFDDRMYYSIDESFANELKAKLASTKEEKVFFLSKKKAAVEEADMKDQEASVSKPMLIKRLANKVPNFFLTEKDTQIRSKLQKYEAKRNTEIEKKKWTVFKEAFWKNAKNLRRQKMRELAPGNPKNNKFRAQKA